MGSDSNVAAAVAFLASGRSAFITGDILDVSGGIWCDSGRPADTAPLRVREQCHTCHDLSIRIHC